MSLREQYEAQQKALQELLATTKEYSDLMVKDGSDLKEYIKIQKEYEIAVKLNLDTQESLREELEVFKDVLGANEQQFVENTKRVKENEEQLKKLSEEMKKAEKRAKDFGEALDIAGASGLAALTSIKSIIKESAKLAISIDSLNVELGRSTGFFSTFRDNLRGIQLRNTRLSISFTESQKILAGLSTGMARFNALGDNQQSVLEDISARFMRLGVDTRAFGQALDTINYSFGLTGAAAANAARSLEGLSKEIGRPVESVVSDLNELGPSLARFGQQGIRVFEKLAKQARELGLTTKQAFDVSELFDTFEGAANIAGRLNAQLGLQLNSVELLKASSEDRIDLLRQEFNLQGVQFESLGRRQRQMIADILGQDEQTAARLLGGKIDITAFQKEGKTPEEQMLSLTEQTNNLLEQILSPLGKIVSDLIPKVKELVVDINGMWGTLQSYVDRFFGTDKGSPAMALTAMGVYYAAKNLPSGGGGGGFFGRTGDIILGASVAAAGGIRRLASGAMTLLGRAGVATINAVSGSGTRIMGAIRGAGAGTLGAISRLHPAGKVLSLGALGLGAMGASGFSARDIIGTGAGILGGVGATAAAGAATGGMGLLASGATFTAGGFAAEKAALALYDRFFGSASAPQTPNTAMSSAARSSMRSSSPSSRPIEIVLHNTVEMDGREVARKTVRTFDNVLEPNGKVTSILAGY